MPSRLTSYAPIVLAIAGAAGCGDGLQPSPPAPAPAAVVDVQIALPVNSLAIGQSVRALLLGRRADGTQTELDGPADWRSSNAAVLSVSSTGMMTARSSGDAEVSVQYAGLSSRQQMNVRSSSPDDLPLRVTVMLSTASVPAEPDIDRVFAKASDIFFGLTRERLLRIGTFNPGRGNTAGQAMLFIQTTAVESLPDAILAFSDDQTAFEFGGYSQFLTAPATFQNRFLPPSAFGVPRLGLAAVHFEHMYSRCGYDNALNRVSGLSFGGECRGQNNLQCVDNGRYWQCPDTLTDLYSEPDGYLACTIVHELAHPYGLSGNNDHYGTDTCVARTGMSGADRNNRRLSQENCGLCPDVYPRIRRR